MILVVDIGNTNITMGFYQENKLIDEFRLTTKFRRTSDEYGVLIAAYMNAFGYAMSDIEDVIISSVVPKINYSFSSSIIKYAHVHPTFVGPGVKTGISVRVEHPSSLGADRLVDVAGAYFTYGGPCIVIDFGTCTTFDVVTEKGELLGGSICAGIGVNAESLSSVAAQLPDIEIVRPETVIAKNTVKAMQAGVVYGYIGQVEYIVKKIKEEYNHPDMKVISTGGLGKIIANETDCIDIYDRHLTFKGLKIIYDKNKNK